MFTVQLIKHSHRLHPAGTQEAHGCCWHDVLSPLTRQIELLLRIVTLFLLQWVRCANCGILCSEDPREYPFQTYDTARELKLEANCS